MEPYRAVFLDAGGTLIHLDRRWLLEQLATHGIERDEAAFFAADAIGRARMREVLRSDDPGDDASRWRIWGRALLTELGCDDATMVALGEAVARRHADARLWTLVEDGTVQALRTLRAAGYRLVVVSNADGRVDSFLRHAGLLDLLDDVVDSGTVGVEKPDPRIFEIACERAGVRPEQAVHVGDVYEIDVLGARRAGVTPLLLDPDDAHVDADCERLKRFDAIVAWLGRVQAPLGRAG